MQNIKKCIRNIYSYIYYIYFKTLHKYNILTAEETINKIINDKVSISRFGDGEFKWLLGIKQKSFQTEDANLSKKLKEVLEKDNPNLLVCIPYSFIDLKTYSKKTSIYWLNFIRWYGKKVSPFLKKKQIYGDAMFTRWYMESKTKDITQMENKIKNLKRIWNNKDIIIVEGKDTKLGVGNSFLDNAKSIKRIIAPQANAFNKYDEILTSLKQFDKNTLFLIALGPTATVLTYDLSLLGYQALDVGHIDIEYEWYLKGATEKTTVKGKFVNEAGGMDDEDELQDNNYSSSIILRIEE